MQCYIMSNNEWGLLLSPIFQQLFGQKPFLLQLQCDSLLVLLQFIPLLFQLLKPQTITTRVSL